MEAEMTRQEMQKAIESKLFTDIKEIGFESRTTIMVGINTKGEQVEVPDYTDDLNACHELEKAIDGLPEKLMYLNFLSPIHSEWTLATATAECKCYAFCRVFWPERFSNDPRN